MDKFYNLVVYFTICLLILLIMYSKFMNLNVFELFTEPKLDKDLTNEDITVDGSDVSTKETRDRFPTGMCKECEPNSYINANKDGCIVCPEKSEVNANKDGCNYDEGYEYYGNKGVNDFYCVKNYYYDGNECIECDSSDEFTYCNGGSAGGNKGKKMLKAGYGTDNTGNIIECTDGNYRKGDVEFGNNINCISCDYRYSCPEETLRINCGGDSEGICSRNAYFHIQQIIGI